MTIGLTCFNAESTIKRAIGSCLGQRWPNLQILIVDDVSSDSTTHIVENCIAHDARARLIRHTHNTGAAGARNTILDQARGEFIVFFDDDDESYPERVAVQVRTLEAYERRTGEKLVACFASGVRCYENGYVKPLPAIGARGKECPHGSGVADWLLFYRRNRDWDYGSGVPACALMGRRGMFAAVEGFDESLRRVEDVDFAIRLALQNGHFIGTARQVFRQYATSGADKTPDKNLKAEQRLVEKHAEYLRAVGRYEYAWRWPRMRYWHFKRRYDKAVLDLFLLMLRNPVAACNHILTTGPKRIVHERNMRRRRHA